MATTDESGNRLSRWLRKSLRRTKDARKSRSRSGCRTVLDPSCISCHAGEDRPPTLPRRPQKGPPGGRQQVLLPQEYHSTTQQPLNNNNLRSDSKYDPVARDACCQQPNGTLGIQNPSDVNQWQQQPAHAHSVVPTLTKDRHASGSQVLHPSAYQSNGTHPSKTSSNGLIPVNPHNAVVTTHEPHTVHRDHGKPRERSHSRGPRQRSPSAKNGGRSTSGPATLHPASQPTSTPITAVPTTPSTLSGASPKHTPSTIKKLPDSSFNRTLPPRNIAMDFPAEAKAHQIPANPSLPKAKPTHPVLVSDPTTASHNISMSSTLSGEPKFHGPTIPGSHMDTIVSHCIVDDEGPASGYRSDSNFILSRGKRTPHRGGSRAPGLVRSDLASGYMSASEHPYIANTRAHSVVSHCSSATLRSEFLAQRSLLSGASQHTATTLTQGGGGGGGGSDGRRTPLQMAMAGNTRTNIPLRSTSPHAVISKDQVFSIYKTYKEELQRTGAEPQQQFLIHTQPQPLHAQFQHQQIPLQQLPSNNTSHCSNDTESELEEIMAQFHQDGALSPDATYESRPRSRRQYKRSRSHDALQRVSHHAGSQGTQRKITHMLSGHLSDGCPSRGSRSRSEPVKPRSVSPSVIPQSKKDKHVTPKSKLKKSKSYHSISPRSSQLSYDKMAENGHVFRTRSIPTMHDPDLQGPGTLMDTSSESSLSCLSSSEEEDEEDIKKASTPNPPAGQRRVRSQHPLQEDEQEGRQFMMRRWWSSLGGMVSPPGDVSEAIPEEDASVWSGDVSMATTASYVPGVSLADKLRLAASKGQIHSVKELVANGASMEPDREGRTALHYAALNGHAAIVQLIGAETNDIDLQDKLGYTALHRAAAQGHLEVIKVLIAEGCLLDKQDDVHGNSALHEAAWNGYSRTLEVLVKSKARVNIVNKAGFTPLHLSAQNGHNQSARVLLYANCNPDAKNNYGDTALHTAARYGHAGVTRILISGRCNMDEANKNGDTALHISAALKRRKIAKLVVDSGIDINIRNKQNESAIDVARRKDHPEIIVIITSQPKVKGKKKKSKKELEALDEKEKKDKKGFFFRKKKAKAQEKEASAKGTMAAPSALRSIAPSIAAPSEISSALYADRNGHDPTYHHYQPAPHTHLPFDAASVHERRTSHRGVGTGSSISQVQGLLSQYSNKDGVQYYRDLAGNVKQGPVGFAPACHCGPQFKRLEQQATADRANLYDHVEAVQRTLSSRLDALDRRTSQQVSSLDRMTRERLSAVRMEREEALACRSHQERIHTERQIEHSTDAVKTELKAWVDARIHTLRSKLESHDDSCDFTHRRSRRKNRDSAPPAGRLYRSKSDETLSAVSGHQGHQSSKSRARMIKELKHLSHTRNQLKDDDHQPLMVREHPVGHSQSRPMTYHEDSEFGRNPDGNSFSEQLSVSMFHASQLEGKTSSPAEAPNRNRDVIIEEDSIHNDIEPSLIFGHHDHSTENADSGCSTNQCPSPQYQYEYATEPTKLGKSSHTDSSYISKSGRSEVIKPCSPEGDLSNSSNDSGNPKSMDNGEAPIQVNRQFFDTVSVQMEKWYERRLNEVERKGEDRLKHESQAMQQRIKTLEDTNVSSASQERNTSKERVRMSTQIEAQIGTQV